MGFFFYLQNIVSGKLLFFFSKFLGGNKILLTKKMIYVLQYIIQSSKRDNN